MLGISRSGFYEAEGRAPWARTVADEALVATITQVHHASRATYGAPRVHAELRLGLEVRCGRKRVARLMCAAGLVGVWHRRKRRGHSHRRVRARVEHAFARLKAWKILRDCRLPGTGVHHAMAGIAHLYNLDLQTA